MDAFRARPRSHAVQPPYNLFERDIEPTCCPIAREHGVTLAMARSAAACSPENDAEQTRFEGDDLRNVDPKFHTARGWPKILALLVS